MITARIVEENGKPVGWIKDFDLVFLEHAVPALPKPMSEQTAIPSAVTTAAPPSPREPEKILPRIDSPPSPGG